MIKIQKLNIQLLSATKNGDLINVKSLIEQGANIHYDNDRPLKNSVSGGYLDIVKYIVERWIDIQENDNLLKLSAESGHIEVVKYLVERGMNVHISDNYALKVSAENGHLEVVKYLIEQGADIHVLNEHALSWSARFGHLDIVKYLIIDYNMVVKKETLTYFKNNNLVDALSIINSSELNSKLENDLNEPKAMNRFKRKV
jgi:ankyrin repeat protein